jgi:hypothetical protein
LPKFVPCAKTTPLLTSMSMNINSNAVSASASHRALKLGAAGNQPVEKTKKGAVGRLNIVLETAIEEVGTKRVK